MNVKIIVGAIIVAAQFLSASCKRSTQSEVSKPDFGAYIGKHMPQVLISQRMDQKIMFCGPYAQEALAAAKNWFSLIGRDLESNFLTSTQCLPANDSETVFVVTSQNWNRAAANVPESVGSHCAKKIDLQATEAKAMREECKQKPGHFYSDIGCYETLVVNGFMSSLMPDGSKDLYEYLKNPFKIFFIEMCHDKVKLNLTMLHETGHMMGLCDQYDAEGADVGFHEKCDPEFRSSVAGVSIMNRMGAMRPTHLTEDDILGIRMLACRRDVESNDDWLRSMDNSFLQSWFIENEVGDAAGRVSLRSEMQRIGYDKFHNSCLRAAGVLEDLIYNQK